MSFLTLASTFGQLYTNGVYVQDGKTTEIERKVYAITPTNNSALVYFSSDLIAKVYSEADLSINSFSQEILNTSLNPQKARFGVANLATTIMKGSVIFSYNNTNENSSCVVSTPMVDIELKKGLFYFEVTDKKVIIACLDGSMKSYVGKKETVHTIGQAVIAEPTTVGILEDKYGVSNGKVNVEAMKRLTTEAKNMLGIRNSILFIRIGGKTIGVDI